MVRNYAVLDASSVLTSFVQLEDGAPGTGQSDHIEVPMDCDLALGRYKWNATAQRFDPISVDTSQKLAQLDGVRAIALGLMAVRDAGTITLPQYTLDWLSWYESSFDFGS